MHPEIQKRAQAEIDGVIGVDRLPNFEDRPHLPYLEAICKETMRYPQVCLTVRQLMMSMMGCLSLKALSSLLTYGKFWFIHSDAFISEL
jgi:hypothetical protein